MTKITTVPGGPRQQGNTAIVLRAFEDLAGQEHVVDGIKITNYQVEGCRGCDACRRRLDEPGCAQKDDAVPLLQRICASDLVAFA